MEQVVSVVETILRISKKLLSNDSSQSSMNISLKRDDNSSYSFGSRSFILVAINSNLKGRYFFSFLLNLFSLILSNNEQNEGASKRPEKKSNTLSLKILLLSPSLSTERKFKMDLIKL